MLISSKNGINLTELIMVCVITGFILLSTSEMMQASFQGQIDYNKNLSVKQYKNVVSERISSKIREAAKAYYSTLSLSIPYNGYSYSVVPEQEALAVLIPKFDSSGDIVQPSSGMTTFAGVAFSIIADPEENGSYILVETHAEFDLATSTSDPLAITVTLPSSWSGGQSYVIAKNLQPASFTNLGSTAFDVEGDMANYAFVPSGEDLFFPSPSGTTSIDDGEYLTRCQFRNYRI